MKATKPPNHETLALIRHNAMRIVNMADAYSSGLGGDDERRAAMDAASDRIKELVKGFSLKARR